MEEWIEFPLYILKDVEGRTALIPNDIQINGLRSQQLLAQKELAAVPKEADPNGAEVRLIKSQLAYLSSRIQNIVENLVPLRSQAEKIVYYIKEPTFNDQLMAENASREIEDGKPVINNQKLMLKTMANNVKKGETILDEAGVGGLSSREAVALWTEIQSRLQVDEALIPFWNLSP
jgi:hypothetical protein